MQDGSTLAKWDIADLNLVQVREPAQKMWPGIPLFLFGTDFLDVDEAIAHHLFC